MHRFLSRTLILLAVAAASGPAARPAEAVELLAVRQWSAPDHTRIVVDLSEAAAYRHRSLEDPARIAVDVSDGTFGFPRQDIVVDDGLVRRVRFNVLEQSGAVQVVVDLYQEARYDVFALEAIETKPDRIVIDVKRPPSLIAPTPRPQADPARPIAPREAQEIGPSEFGDFLVMVDPGHGGEDSGRRNPDGLKEKDLALELSKTLVQEINSRPGYRAELTRTGDYFVSLGRRRQIAEQRGANLFVSVHFNAAPSRTARGTEIFFVSLSGAEGRATRELESAENSADLVGGIPPNDQPTSDALSRMLVNLRQNDSVERSQHLATRMTDHVARLRGIETRRVKQAGFAVLKSLFIPAVLVEAGFLTNTEDARYFRSSKNRETFARSLADGLEAYCEEVEVPRLGWKIHTVNSGETLSGIAVAYAMNVSDLRGVNNLPGDRITVGQKLKVRPR